MATVSLDAARPEVGGRRRRLVLSLALCALAGAATVHADLWVREKITGSDGKSLGERTWSSTAGRVRMDEGNSGFLLDAAAGHGWIWGWDGSGCRELPFPARASATGSAPGAARLPSILQGVGGNGALVPRQEQRRIAGYDARRFDVVDGSDIVQERWMASSLPNADFDRIVQDWNAPGQLNPWLGLEETRIAIQSVGMGFPLRVVDHRNGNTLEAVEIRTTALSPSTFSPPPACPGR